ncbi:MAG: hypothetical protein KF824_08350 [Fimbriimonadaceae bacterium]|nr:MAG: hypothetical protein KF824_08350 [Fimbriimonadaceae bacterium]
MLTALVCGLVLAGQEQFDFYDRGWYLPGVPKPESILGYELGSKHTVYRDQERVVTAIAASSPERVRMMEYGKSTEGRTLRVLAISSPENIARLDEIQADLGRLANPKPGDDIAAIQKRTPVLVWINECIHGDETASFESAMALIYNLAASNSAEITSMLRDAVVMVNPVYNPDGHERYVVAYNSIPNGNPGRDAYDRAMPSAFFGRANHYRFDMNRDRISMSQAETRQEVAMFLKWNPQVYVDQHGQVETYFFPPVQQSVNVNADRNRYNHWTDVFGRATAKAFDNKGWTYFIRDSFDFYNVCYLDSHTTLMGAIGMTHETDGGRVMSQRRVDDTILTMRQGAEKHFTAALAVISSAAKNRAELLKSYSDFKAKAVSGEHAGKFHRVILDGNQSELTRLQEHLARSGIVAQFAGEVWLQKGAHDYWSDWKGNLEVKQGMLVVDMNQSQGPLAKALLEPFSDFEPEFIARQRKKALEDKENRPNEEIDYYEFYDSTAWALPYAYNLKAWWCESRPEMRMVDRPPYLGGFDSRAPNFDTGYALEYKDITDLLFIADALSKDFKISLITKESQFASEKFPPGTFLILSARNSKASFAKLEEAYLKLYSRKTDSEYKLHQLRTSYPDEGRQGPGSESVVQLRKPKIGVVFGNAGNLRAGALWYLLEQEFKLPYDSLSSSVFNRNLDEYTCLIVPGGVGARPTGKLREWVENGGCLIALGGVDWVNGKDAFLNLDEVTTDPDLPGAIFQAELDPFSYLSYGYPRKGNEKIKIAVPIDGSSFWKAPIGGSAVQLSADESVKKLLCGWSWDETEKDLQGITWAHDERVGQGRVVAFPFDPTDRAQWPGLYKMLLNAMILGPSR